MKTRTLLLTFAALAAVGTLRAQVTKEVEVTKAYIPEVSAAVKLPFAPDMTDTVRLRPEIDYTITPLAMATNLSTEPFRPATVTYWEFNRPLRHYLKAGMGAPLNSVLDYYYATQNPGTGYAMAYVNHEGEYGRQLNDFGVRDRLWRMRNAAGGAAGLYLGRHRLEGGLDLRLDEWHRPMFAAGADPLKVLYGDYAFKMRVGDDFTDLSRFNFDVHARVGLYGDYSDRLLAGVADLQLPDRNRQTALEAGFLLGQGFGRSRLLAGFDFERTWSNYDYDAKTFAASLRYGYTGERFALEAGLKLYVDRIDPFSSTYAVAGEPVVLPRSNGFRHTFVLPLLELRFGRVQGGFVPFVSLDGEHRTNSVATLVREDPFYVSGMGPVDRNTVDYRLRAGVAGTTGKGLFAYRLYAGFTITENQLYWYGLAVEPGPGTLFVGVDTGTQRHFSVNAELEWRPATSLRFTGAVSGFFYDNDDSRLCNGMPRLTARLTGELTLRKVSLEVGARMQSVRDWSVRGLVWTVSDDPAAPGVRLETSQGAFRAPIGVDLSARFNWHLTPRVTLFADGHNLCDAKLYRQMFLREYGVGFTAGVKLQF